MSLHALPTFGRYVVSARVAEGSLGVVYRARHTELDRDAAVKELRPEVRGNAAAVAGMVAEAATLARLDHPHVVALYDFVQEPGRTWLAEQWVDGVPLDELLATHGRLTPEQALGVLTGALSGLAHAHDHGVVHRDVSASNVLADLAGTSMLLDFGLASPVPDGAGPESSGVVGTPAYLSPEAARGDPVGKPGDVYSAGALAFHLLSGAPVFAGTAWELVAAHRDRQAPGLEGHGPALAGLLARSLDKDPAVRPPDAGAFLRELEEAAAHRYGADWRSRASIAGLVASALGTVAAVGGAGGGATVVAAGFPTAAAATRATVSTGRRFGPRTFVGAGIAAGAVVVAVLAAVSLGQDGDAERPSSEPPRSATPVAAEGPSLTPEEEQEQRRERAVEALEASVPSGKYFWTSPASVVRLRDGSTTRSPANRGTWTFAPSSCSPTRCAVQVESSSGAIWRVQWTGADMTINRPVLKEPKAACVAIDTGEVQPIEQSAASVRYVYDVGPVSVTPGDAGRPDGFTFSYDVALGYRFFGDCEAQPTDEVAIEGITIVASTDRPRRGR